jgi:hypothetical protein
MNLGGKWELFFPSELGYNNYDSDSYISGDRVHVFRFERHINVIITSFKKSPCQKLSPDLPQLIEALFPAIQCSRVIATSRMC